MASLVRCYTYFRISPLFLFPQLVLCFVFCCDTIFLQFVFVSVIPAVTVGITVAFSAVLLYFLLITSAVVFRARGCSPFRAGFLTISIFCFAMADRWAFRCRSCSLDCRNLGICFTGRAFVGYCWCFCLSVSILLWFHDLYPSVLWGNHLVSLFCMYSVSVRFCVVSDSRFICFCFQLLSYMSCTFRVRSVLQCGVYGLFWQLRRSSSLPFVLSMRHCADVV